MTPKYLIFPFVLTVLACLALARLAPWLALMDRPDARKQHRRDTPVVGGIAILLSYLLATKLRGISGNLVTAMLPVGLMLVVGMADDMRPLPARIKLLCQIAAAWLLVRSTGFMVETIPLPGLGSLSLGPLAMPLTVLVFVAVINAINMSDGADGLAGGYVLIALGFFAALSVATGQAVMLLLLVGLISAVLGFLVCNARYPLRPQALVFMGDAGALALGTLLCWFGLKLVDGSHGALPPILILYAVALPIFDMLTVSMRRLLRGASPFVADRSHIHHLLDLRGYPVTLMVLLLWLLDAVLVALSFFLWRSGVSAEALSGVFIILFVAKLLWLHLWNFDEMHTDG